MTPLLGVQCRALPGTHPWAGALQGKLNTTTELVKCIFTQGAAQAGHQAKPCHRPGVWWDSQGTAWSLQQLSQ